MGGSSAKRLSASDLVLLNVETDNLNSCTGSKPVSTCNFSWPTIATLMKFATLKHILYYCNFIVIKLKFSLYWSSTTRFCYYFYP